MINASDKNVNVFHKGWQRNPSSQKPETGYEDPTYLGFKLIFFPNGLHNHETGLNDNALFTPKEELIEGAENYLESIDMGVRASMIKKFREAMLALTRRTPWYIQSVEGVAALWNINKKHEEFDPYRGKELYLTFNCLESIDLRITEIADLYRKASFDAKFMREILPSNLREFRCELQIAEFRQFHTISKKIDSISTAQNNDNANNSNVQSGSHGEALEFLSDYISIITFDLRDCVFDFEESFPGDTFNVAGDYSQATQKFKIHVGKVYKERNQYTLLETILADDYINGASSILKGDISTNEINGDLDDKVKRSQFLDYNKVDQSVVAGPQLDSSKKSELQRRLERGTQAVANRGRDEMEKIKDQAKNLINEKIFDNKISDAIKGFLGEVVTGKLGNSFSNPDIKYPGVQGKGFDGNPPIEYPGTNGAVYDPGHPEYPGTNGAVYDPGHPEYPGTNGAVYDPGHPSYPGTNGTVFENPAPVYPGVKDKSFENPPITYPGVKDKSFENPAQSYPGVSGKAFEGNPDIKYDKTNPGKSFDGNPDIKYSAEPGKTFSNPDLEYPGVHDKSFDGNPDIKYEAPSGNAFNGKEGTKTSVVSSLEKVFDLSNMTEKEIQKMESVFKKENKEVQTGPLGDLFESVPGKDLGVPYREYTKPEGNVFPEKEESKNSDQELGTVYKKPDNKKE
jgi:hypothetical protein